MSDTLPTFEVQARIGRGGMGEVFLATMKHAGLEQQVALKRMRVDVAETAAGLSQFQREAQICALLKHENIVALRAYGRDAVGPFLALEFVDGASASQLLGAFEVLGEPLPAGVVWQLALDLTRGLDAAHRREQPVIHRDLSPDNVLIAFDGVAKVGDFGIAKLAGGTSFTTTGTVKGKYGYLAPELFDGGEADVQSDYFALAATLYKLWCGLNPFRGKTEAELLRSVLGSEPVLLSKLRADVPLEVERWLHAALAKQRTSRPKSLEPLIAALTPVAGGREAVGATMLRAFPDRRRPGLDEGALVRQTASVIAVAGPPKRRRAWPLALVPLLALAVGGSWWLRPVPAAPVTQLVVAKAPEPEAPKPVLAPEPPPEPEPAAPAPASKGMLWVKVKPWGRVFVDGRLRGTTPLAALPLPTGTHQVMVVNEQLKKQKTYSVDVRAGKTTELKVVLSE